MGVMVTAFETELVERGFTWNISSTPTQKLLEHRLEWDVRDVLSPQDEEALKKEILRFALAVNMILGANQVR